MEAFWPSAATAEFANAIVPSSMNSETLLCLPDPKFHTSTAYPETGL